ncbi:hypothetical protein ACQCSX_20550 [Pseudarthrobacter sp. P1]|uniref:hypothetical protein n=1 Tax=Pseudarthrobacter sp. P1 TaxID=3418418 RepID=UPI003CF0A96D
MTERRQPERVDPPGPSAPLVWGRVPAAGLGLALIVAATAALAGYQVLPWAAKGYTPPPAALVDHVDCLATAGGPGLVPGASHPPQPVAGSVPEGFFPVLVVLCSGVYELETTPEGQWSVRSEDHLAGDPGPLLATLARPSDRAREGQACTADGVVGPTIWLMDARGRAMVAARPSDVCGKPKPGVGQLLATMPVAESIKHRLQLLPSATPKPAPAPMLPPATPKPAPSAPGAPVSMPPSGAVTPASVAP